MAFRSFLTWSLVETPPMVTILKKQGESVQKEDIEPENHLQWGHDHLLLQEANRGLDHSTLHWFLSPSNSPTADLGVAL